MSTAYDVLVGKIEGAPLYEPSEFAVMQSWTMGMVKVAMKFAEAYHAHEMAQEISCQKQQGNDHGTLRG